LPARVNRLLHHGGRLREAAARYGIPAADWIDLSTGINPHGWPVPPIPDSAWARLPDDDELEQNALTYYGARHLLPVAGSQAAIQALPQLRASSRVGVLVPDYSEHAHAWQRAGHEVMSVAADDISARLNHFDLLVLSNPNNPTGRTFPREQLLAWHQQLAARGGWLVVDEAFMDVTPEQSLAPHSSRPGLIVLRSLGKFFGLAGARVGFVCAGLELLSRLEHLLGPWTISGPARHVACLAVQDRRWQVITRRRLARQGERLRALLTHRGYAPDGGCTLFQWRCTPRAGQLQEQLASRGILIRCFDHPSSVRFGLPREEADWRRLDAALAEIES